MDNHSFLPPQTPVAPSGFNLSLYKSRANWLYWVAALSLVNQLSAILNFNFSFYLSLGIVDLLNYIGSTGGAVGNISLVLGFLIVVAIGACGYFAVNKLNMMGLLLGLGIMILDTLLLIVAGALSNSMSSVIIGVLIHMWACGSLFLAVTQLKKSAVQP